MSNTTARIVIHQDGRSYTLFSISERKKGDVIITQKIPIYRSGHKLLKNASAIRLSIHPSPQSVDGINTVQWTISYVDGTIRRLRNYTRAVKDQEGFCPIGIFRVNRFSSQAVTTSKDRKTMKVGVIDQSRSMLFLGLFVSAPNVVFPKEAIEDISIYDMIVADFRLTALCSYARLPSHNSFDSCQPAIEDGVQAELPGLSPLEAVVKFRRHRDMLFWMLQRALRIMGFSASQTLNLPRAFSKDG